MDLKSRRKKALPHLPIEEMQAEIFLRLPLKTIFRFKCVSKKWQACINDPSFAHEQRSKNPPSSDSVGFFYQSLSKSSTKLSFFSVSEEGDRLKENPTFTEFLTSMNLRVRVTSFEGLVLCSSHVHEHGDYHVCDPTTGIRLHLSNPSHRLHDNVHLGLICNPPTSSYMVVCLFWPTKEKGGQTNTIEVETYFSMTDRWKTSTLYSTSPIGFICYDRHGVELNEALHWIDTSGHVLSYNPTEDSIGLVKLPVAPFRPGYEFLTHSLGVSEESSLFYSTYDYEELAISVWNLEEYSTSTWSLKYKIRETVQIWQCPWNFFTKKQRILIHMIDRGMINYDLENEVSCIMDFRQPMFKGVNYFTFTPSTWRTLVPPSSSQ